MELQEFVTETLKQIVHGVRDALKARAESGALISPLVGRLDTAGGVFDRKTGNALQEVEFDVAVTATEGTARKSGIGVMLGSVGVGTQGKAEASNSSVSRIRFTVPIGLPPAE